MVAAYLSGNCAEATKLQLDCYELVKALFIEVNPIPVKAALNMMGMNAGGYRAPLIEMEESNRLVLEKAMHNFGLI